MNTTHRPYRQDADQREREAILKNDRANTFAGRAQAEADEIQGRWAQEHKATVIGTGPVVYPRLPENSWTHDPTGFEPSLGIDVNAVEPCGEKFEIEAMATSTTGSHQPAPPRHDERGSVGSPLAGADERSIVCDPSDDDVEPTAPASNPKRRRA
jgi:hypothetical protein